MRWPSGQVDRYDDLEADRHGSVGDADHNRLSRDKCGGDGGGERGDFQAPQAPPEGDVKRGADLSDGHRRPDAADAAEGRPANRR